MRSLLTVSDAQERLREQVRARRLQQGFTQKGLADRSGVSLPSLRKFEQKGLISLESLLKLLIVLGCLEKITNALEVDEEHFNSIDDVLANRPGKPRKHGWRT